eukprot:SAG31_NODE_46585_length_253_cov_15.974026_1_plen_57_part_10
MDDGWGWGSSVRILTDDGWGSSSVRVKSWVAHYLEEWLQGEFTVPGVLDPGDSPIDC